MENVLRVEDEGLAILLRQMRGRNVAEPIN
jgi:hypothetical protein